MFKTGFFSFARQKKWLLVVLDRWLSYTVTIVWIFAWTDSALVVLEEWSSYRGTDSALVLLEEWSSYREGHLNRLTVYEMETVTSGCFIEDLIFLENNINNIVWFWNSLYLQSTDCSVELYNILSWLGFFF